MHMQGESMNFGMRQIWLLINHNEQLLFEDKWLTSLLFGSWEVEYNAMKACRRTAGHGI